MQFDFNKLPRKKPEPLQKNYICEYVQTKSLRFGPPIYNFESKDTTYKFSIKAFTEKSKTKTFYFKNIYLTFTQNKRRNHTAENTFSFPVGF